MWELLADLWLFVRVRKKIWLLPIVIVLVLLGAFLILVQGTTVGPFIYTLF